MFTDFTKSLDVIGHELTHGVTEFVSGLEYHDQSGALNESMSDVFGVAGEAVVARSDGRRGRLADRGGGVHPGIDADALRSMKAPGTAYDNDLMGKDPQPDHMSKYVDLPDTNAGDNGGVHINSGIPNKAFYLTAWGSAATPGRRAGHIWYESLRASGPTTQFQEFADTTYLKAGQLYGAASAEQQAVLAAWRDVGIRIAGCRAAAAGPGDDPRRPRGRGQGLAGDPDQADRGVAAQVKSLTKDVGTLKGKK